MAEVKPFSGIIYNQEKVDIEKVVTPPYDVISPAMQKRFYKRDSRNIIRLILGKDKKGDTGRNNKYYRAKRYLAEWLKNSILIKDKKPAIYVYTHEYTHKGKKKTRVGFIALMKLEKPGKGGILPHEYTLRKPKEDRLNLIKNVKANLSPIFGLFGDEKNRINRILKYFVKFTPPFFEAEQEGVIHRLWRLVDKSAIKKIRTYMKGKKVFIADGHHRYEVALAYRDMMRNAENFKENMNYVMMYFSNLNERGSLTILSTHRIVTVSGQFDEKALKEKLRKYFSTKPLRTIPQCIERLESSPKNEHRFGMYAGNKKIYLLKLKKGFSPERLIDSKKNTSLKKLDVTILHDLIIDKILCLKNPENGIKYIRDAENAASLAKKKGHKIAFFLKPTDVLEMKNVAEQGEMMPQKSTYFYPKLLSGLVINKF